MTEAHAGDAPVRKDRTKAAPTRTRAEAEHPIEETPNFFRRIWLFLTQIVSELKKVTYPTSKETWTYFVVVIVFVAVIMAYTGLLDFAFGKLNALVFG
ncbi:preprotein translocase subunit SecE [Schaalia sp. Marseille-Q2122]|uniref:preprotein translocase subunit SecE n=1 Tax=Schaalia sp. Marseille-Q2122 TaxID=2736604 RepID=UPI001588E974|nr:preprotein translocase subunit SecE [Schaalia sp. Marseille-Q2122]